MPKDYYPAFYEVYVETFFAPPPGGRGYSSEKVLKKGLSKDEADAMVKELRPMYFGDKYVSARKMVD